MQKGILYAMFFPKKVRRGLGMCFAIKGIKVFILSLFFSLKINEFVISEIEILK